MNENLIEALDALEKSKGLSKEVILEAIEKALEKSYEKNYDDRTNVDVVMDRESGDIRVYSLRNVVDVVDDPVTEISLAEAKGYNPSAEVGGQVRVEVSPENFGRVAAGTARNIVIQKLHDAERETIYDAYIDQVREIINGTVQRVDRGNVFINLGKTEGIVPSKEQIPGEHLKPGDRVKLYVADVRNSSKGAQVLLSRAHPNLVTRLFEQEVPEIGEGIVEIYSVAREPGSRSKVAVYSMESDVDPIGACVGYKGSRVNFIVEELGGEKMDITIYDTDPQIFIANALSPAKVSRVIINEKEKTSVVVVPDDQLSLAIGKEGQNVRLAARLTGWKIDIKGESQYFEDPEAFQLSEEDEDSEDPDLEKEAGMEESPAEEDVF